MHRGSIKVRAVTPAPPQPPRALRSPPPSTGSSCHVPGPWLSGGSWGGALFLLGKAPYLISQGPRLTDRRAWSLSHPLPGPLAGHQGVAGFGDG